MQITTVTQKGQFTIPADIRESLGIRAGDKLVSEKVGNGIMVKPIPDFFSLKGSVKTKNKNMPLQKLIDKETKSARGYVVGRNK